MHRYKKKKKGKNPHSLSLYILTQLLMGSSPVPHFQQWGIAWEIQIPILLYHILNN